MNKQEPIYTVRGVPMLLSRTPDDWLLREIKRLLRELEDPTVFSGYERYLRDELKVMVEEARHRGIKNKETH